MVRNLLEKGQSLSGKDSLKGRGIYSGSDRLLPAGDQAVDSVICIWIFSAPIFLFEGQNQNLPDSPGRKDLSLPGRFPGL
jgi:hypothetical protein